MKWFEIARELLPTIRGGNTQLAIERISEALRSLPVSPFHRVLDLDFTNSPEQVAKHFDDFARIQKSRFNIGAIYTETNGFDINPDRWYFDLFAYRDYGGQDNWLAHWDSDASPELTLTGLETLQAVYESNAFRDKAYRPSREFCSLLVVAKFQDLIRRSIPFMHEVQGPVLATSHDYDFIAEFQM